MDKIFYVISSDYKESDEEGDHPVRVFGIADSLLEADKILREAFTKSGENMINVRPYKMNSYTNFSGNTTDGVWGKVYVCNRETFDPNKPPKPLEMDLPNFK